MHQSLDTEATPLPALPSDVVNDRLFVQAVAATTLLDGLEEVEEQEPPKAEFNLPKGKLLVKRGLDLAIAMTLGLVVLLPALFFAASIRLGSPGPVLFRQIRIGRDGQPFTVLKFRTMHVDAEHRLSDDSELLTEYVTNNFKLVNQDPRLTRVGKRLRKFSLDELPQLLNVIGGQMSMVGPRPVVPAELLCYGPYIDAYLAVRPGLTGAWQVTGRSHVGYPERAAIDFRYVSNWSLFGDLKLIFKTVPALILARGAV